MAMSVEETDVEIASIRAVNVVYKQVRYISECVVVVSVVKVSVEEASVRQASASQKCVSLKRACSRKECRRLSECCQKMGL